MPLLMHVFYYRLQYNFSFLKRSRPQQLTLCQSLHAEELQATASEGLAQGPYVATIVGFEPTTLRSKGINSTVPHAYVSVDLLLSFLCDSLFELTWGTSVSAHMLKTSFFMGL